MHPTVAFLFDSTSPAIEGNYAEPGITGVIDAIVSAARRNALNCRVHVGDVALRVHAERRLAVSIEQPSAKNRNRRRMTTTVNADHDLLSAIVWDLLDNVQEQWHTVDFEDVLRPLAGNGLFSVSCFNIPHETAVWVDAHLIGIPHYVGTLQVDLANLIQRDAFLMHLIPTAVLSEHALWVRSEDLQELIAPFWALKLRNAEPIVVQRTKLSGISPELVLPTERSPAGERTAELLQAHKRQNTKDALINHVFGGGEVVEEGSYGRIEVHAELDSALRDAEIPESKLTKYALCRTHPTGKHKAKLFEELLAITLEDWRYLAAQLLCGLPTAKIYKVRVSEHGVKYSADIPVKGLNGNVKMVTTGWLAVGDNSAKLTTLLIAGKNVELSGDGVIPPVITNASNIEEHFRLVYEAAVREAETRAAAMIPIPMKVEGFGVEREGAVGFALVRVRDGRSSFVRWLRKSGIGSRHHRKGWAVDAFSGSQSIDRNRAYAEALAEVFRFNGIECEVEWWYD